MRKLLLNSTAIATVAALTASVAVADVSISASTEFKYKTRGSLVAANDTTTNTTDSEIVFKFSNKTDSGLTIGYVAELTAGGTGTDGTFDESSLSIAGGFGKVVLGENDGVGDNFGIAAVDLIAEENLDSVKSARVSTNSDIVQGAGDNTKIAYFMPAMGNLTAGVSSYEAGSAAGDTTTFGAAYAMDVDGIDVTIGGASTSTPVANAKNTQSHNVGIKVATMGGDLKMTLSRGSYAAVDENRDANGFAASYKLTSDITVGAYTVNSKDAKDAGEKYEASGVEAQYTIAAGLTAVVSVGNYDYQVGTNADTDMSAVSDNGTSTSVTIKASF